MAQSAKRRARRILLTGPRSKRLLERLFFLALTLAGAIYVPAHLGEEAYPIGPFHVSLRWSPARSGTSELVFPPLGRVSAHTHKGPTRLEASLDAVDFQALAKLVSADLKRQEEAFHEMAAQAEQAALRFVRRIIAWAA